MAFESISNSLGMNSVNYGRPTTLDQSQIDKMKESGLSVVPIANISEGMNIGTPTAKQIMPGVSVPGTMDSRGNFFVTSETGIVHQVVGSTGGGRSMPESSPPLGPPLMYDPPGTPFAPPEMSPPLPPPPNFGSGKIFARFDLGDVVPNQEETVTRALWSGNIGTLTTFYTSSTQTATQKRYYYEVYQSGSGLCGSEAQFSVVYGNKAGSGSADEGGQINDNPSRAIYGQWRLLCLNGDTPRFTFGGKSTDQIYGILVNRSRMREAIDEGNLEVNIAHLSGSLFLAGGGAQNAHTGSNVKLAGNSRVLRLIDDSTINPATITDAGEVYQIVSGTLEDGVYNSSSPHVYGAMYRRLGAIVLDADKLDISASFLTVTGSEVEGDNAMKLYTAMSGAALFSDASGDRLGFSGRSMEKVKSTHFFCRVKNGEFNFSNNPTFVTGSEGDLAEPLMIGNPIVYITTIGLYNERKEMVAVAKVSRPVRKTFSEEALVKIKLEF